MQNVFNPMVSMYWNQLETLRRASDAVFFGIEKMDRLCIAAAHRLFAEQLMLAKNLTTIRDPRNLGNVLQSNMLSRNPEENVNYQKEAMQIITEMQNELGRSMQDYIEQLGTNVAATSSVPLAPAQGRTNEAMLNPMTSMFSVWESAFKEAAALAKRNMMAARSVATETAGRTMQGAEAYAATAVNAARETANIVADSAASASRATGKNMTSIIDEGGGNEKRPSSHSPAGGSKRK